MDPVTATSTTSRPPRTRVTLTVNGVPQELLIPPSRSLADTLRYDLGLTGTKRACNEGECGSCSVLLDGEVVNSCLVPAVEAEGHLVITIEGLAADGRLDPVQRAFADNFAAQCGYCTPGMIMTAKALLDKNPDPTEAEIRDGIRGNLCRCTGYAKIVQAIGAAAGARRGRRTAPAAHEVVGRSLRRVDADEKVTGKAAYAYDMALPGMVYGEILRSPVAHARITRVDTATARELPGVLAVLTQADMPPARFGAFTQDETALGGRCRPLCGRRRGRRHRHRRGRRPGGAGPHRGRIRPAARRGRPGSGDGRGRAAAACGGGAEYRRPQPGDRR